MGRKSSIDKLEPKFKEELDRLIRDGAFTIDEMMEHMQEQGAPVKRSAIGDYAKRMNDRLASYRDAQAVASGWVRDLGEQPDSKTGQLLAELLKTIAFRTLADMGDSQNGIEPQELSLLARALKDMAGAQKVDLEFRGRLRSEWKAELAERAAAAADEAKAIARTDGLSEDAANRIRAAVFGIVG